MSRDTGPPANGRPGDTAPRFTLDEVELDAEPSGLSPSQDRRGLTTGTGPSSDAAVFNLDLDYSDDDALLDWEQYAGLRRFRCCGREWTLPSWARPRPPDWWWTYTKRQRRLLLSGAACCLTFILLIAALAAAAASGHSILPGLIGRGDAEYCAWVEPRLPPGIVPRRYALTLGTKMAAPYAVEGSLTIDLNVTKAARCVVLHAASGLGIQGVWLGNGTGGAQGELRDRPGHQQLVLQFPSTLQPGEGNSLHFRFAYNLSEGLSGFYRSSYTLGAETHSLATTQFEATSARSAFPCFDEPALKAVFVLTVEAPATYTVLSNMPASAVHHHHEEGEGHGPALASWHFPPTPPMSTYLLAIVIGELAGTSRLVPGATAGADPRNVTVWGTPDRRASLEFAADIASKVLPAYEAAFGVPYSMPKLDLVAIPDFSAGAMENWGLILYRETALLTSPTSSLADRRWVAKVVAHEMAHMWFGDLVTMEWWGELWLNEGFASYLEFLGAQAASPELDIFLSFYTDVLPDALEEDSLNSSHPLSIPQGVNTSERIESLFDSIEYNKGAAVLRMLRAWVNRGAGLGALEAAAGINPAQDPFLAGLQAYLNLGAYNATTGSELWRALAGPLGLPDLPKRMRAWTYQQGYPLVRVSLDEGGRVWLQQSRFGIAGVTPCDSTAAFWLPVALATADTPTGKPTWTEFSGCQSAAPVLQNAASAGTWVKANAGQYGFFRVQYDEALWARLVAAAPTLPPTDLAGLLEDSWALAEAGELGIDTFLNLVGSLAARSPEDYEPWAAALPYLERVAQLAPCSTLWQNYLAQTLFNTFLRQDAGGQANTSTAPPPLAFSFDAPSPEGAGVGQRLLRPAILAAAGRYGHLAITAQALELVPNLTASSVDPDARSALLATAVRAGHRDVWEGVHRLYLAADAADERERTLRALAAAPGAAADPLDWSLGPEVRAQDMATVIVTAARARPDTPSLVWAWLGRKWRPVSEKLGGGNEGARRMGSLLESVASLFSNQTAIPEVEAVFAASRGVVTEGIYLERARETIETNAVWVTAHGSKLCTWAAQHAKLKP
uniref:Alpha-aminoacylpeptide hydrolase n=1 Tax=Auxenochlorella protothecoides TaxID=3075 RepID=A0A1D2A2H1_AUXPR